MVSIRMECIQISDRPFKFYWGGDFFQKKQQSDNILFWTQTKTVDFFSKMSRSSGWKLQGLTIRTFHVVNLLFLYNILRQNVNKNIVSP
jgi:hypothetical protein